MRYSLVFFLVPALASPQRQTTPVPVTPRTGGVCCSANGVADPSGTCAGAKLNSYCCSAFPNFEGSGCDGHGINGFPTGRTVQSFPPGGNDGKVCGFLGFVACAE
ncbi:hypothetical protein LZ31DRAFT_563093 [Colletotrichum somersetense]|nr:hypothetical protein LZ31DRAFT_563093 [Colletotrichum somersetense]